MKTYENINSEEDLVDFAKDITRKRNEDINEFNNLQNIFMRGRKVSKVPTAFDDTATTDREGDFNYDASYIYLAVNDSGTIKWSRVAISVSW